MVADGGYPTVAQLNADTETYVNNARVRIIGILSKVTKKMTKNETMMAILQLQDITGNVEVLLFAKAYEKYSHMLEEDKVVLISGKISIREDNFGKEASDEEGMQEETRESVKIICNEIVEINSPTDQLPQEKPKQEAPRKLLITFTKNDTPNLDRCISLLQENQGSSPVFFNFTDMGKQARFKGNDVFISEKLLSKLGELLNGSKVQVRS